MVTKNDFWPWIIVFFGLLFSMIRSTTDRCYSMFYLHWMYEYDIEYTYVSMVMGAFYVGYAASGLLCLVLVKYWSLRQLMIACGMLAAVSTSLAVIHLPFWCVVALFGAIPGLCFGMQLPLVLRNVTNCVPKNRRVLALQLVFMGYGLGPFLGCPTWQVLISNYTWRGAILIISAIYLHTVAVAGTMNPNAKMIEPLKVQNSAKDKVNVSVSRQTQVVDAPNCCGSKTLQSIYFQFDLGFFTLPATYIMLLFFSGFVSGVAVTVSYIVPYGIQELGLTEVQASFLPSAIAVGEMSAKVIVGMFFHKIKESRRKLLVSVEFLIAAVLLAILSSLRGYISVMILCVGIGLLEGATDGILVNYFVEIFPEKYFAAANSYLNLIGFLIVSVANLLAGITVDQTGKLSNVLYLGASMYVAASVGMFLLHIRCPTKKQQNVTFSQLSE
uniref:Monocarboxylate transporter 12-like n=1 Tax=Phallusia mammillata TaxID=59560 RepID=A0A6F9DRP2_9ASCI|nr:monocarboxylate transporter 12-like [Phallusia mammillata]